ncbi:P-loop containing nucleoside triphosphate hydrolase protein, partial [Ceratobasidium sp. AG-I]
LAQPNDIVIVVSPLKLLEKNMVLSLERKGLSAVALNADTISALNEDGRDVWEECAQGAYRVVLCSPERLASGPMIKLISRKDFQSRVSLVVVDEVHLIPIWGGDGSGRAFRSAFTTIGLLRSILDSGTAYLGISGTLRLGEPTETVKEQLGFDGPKFSFMKLDCERTNLHIVVRRISHAFTQNNFADLDWLILSTISCPQDIPKTVVYIDNIIMGHALVAYLRMLLPSNLQTRASPVICHLHASTCSQCKDDAMAEFSNPKTSRLRIVVATEAFGCGVDIPDIERVINFGTPHNLDALYQRIGRAARALPSGFGYVYVNPKLWDDTVETVPSASSQAKAKRTKKTPSTPKPSEEGGVQSCDHFKQVLEAHLKGECITRCINALYDNPLENKPERCGRCSGCVKDCLPSTRESSVNESVPEQPQTICADPIPHIVLKGFGKPSKAMLDQARSRLADAARDTWLSVPASSTLRPFGGLRTFLSTYKSSFLIKRILDLETAELVRRALGNDWEFWDTHGERLAAQVLNIR